MKSTLKMAVLAAAMGLLGMACGGPGGAGTVSCTTGTGSSLGCVEYNWSGLGYTDIWSAACTQGGGTAGTGCTHAGAVGGCKLTVTTGGTSLSTTAWYYSGSASSLQSACTASSSGSTTAVWLNP